MQFPHISLHTRVSFVEGSLQYRGVKTCDLHLRYPHARGLLRSLHREASGSTSYRLPNPIRRRLPWVERRIWEIDVVVGQVH